MWLVNDFSCFLPLLLTPFLSSRKAGPDYISAEAASSLSKQVEKASSLSKQRDITFYITEMPTEQLAKMKVLPYILLPSLLLS